MTIPICAQHQPQPISGPTGFAGVPLASPVYCFKEILMTAHSKLIAGVFLALAGVSQAQTTVSEPWVRSTVAGQKATGAYLQISSATGGRLISAASPLAGLVEIHEMTMDGNVMKMRALPNGLELPAGKAVALKPGGLHVMLMDLKQALKAGDTVPLTLVVEGAGNKRETLEVKATVRSPQGAAASAHNHKH